MPTVAVVTPDDRGRRTTHRPAGPARGLFAGADLCARQRLPEGLEGRYRHAGEGRQLLAEIDAPDLDQQIMQAEADLASAQANLDARGQPTLERGQPLIGSGAVSKQDLDQRAADAQSRQGLLKSAQANLDRLQACWRTTSASPRRSTGW